MWALCSSATRRLAVSMAPATWPGKAGAAASFSRPSRPICRSAMLKKGRCGWSCSCLASRRMARGPGMARTRSRRYRQPPAGGCRAGLRYPACARRSAGTDPRRATGMLQRCRGAPAARRGAAGERPQRRRDPAPGRMRRASDRPPNTVVSRALRLGRALLQRVTDTGGLLWPGRRRPALRRRMGRDREPGAGLRRVASIRVAIAIDHHILTISRIERFCSQNEKRSIRTRKIHVLRRIKMQTHTKIPPVTATQLIVEALGGALAGLACAVIAGLISARLFSGANNGWGDLFGAVLGTLIGYAVGVTLGVYAAGRRLTGRGSIWLSLLGSVLGVLLVVLAAEPLGLNTNPAVLQAAFVIVTAIAATLVFNFRRLFAGGPKTGG